MGRFYRECEWSGVWWSGNKSEARKSRWKSMPNFLLQDCRYYNIGINHAPGSFGAQRFGVPQKFRPEGFRLKVESAQVRIQDTKIRFMLHWPPIDIERKTISLNRVNRRIVDAGPLCIFKTQNSNCSNTGV